MGELSDGKTEDVSLEIVTSDGERSSPPIVSRQVAYSLFQAATGTKEYHTEQYDGSKIITKHDVQQLCYKLAAWLTPLAPVAYSIRFIVVHRTKGSNLLNRKILQV